jgi:hypothetical protein
MAIHFRRNVLEQDPLDLIDIHGDVRDMFSEHYASCQPRSLELAAAKASAQAAPGPAGWPELALQTELL